MGKLIWLASYPKSGNTWLRAFLHNLLRNPDRPFDINDLRTFCVVDSVAELYAQVDPRPPASLGPEGVARLRPSVHRFITTASPDNVFVKTHNALMADFGVPTVTAEVTAGMIYVVRNPLDVAVSFAHHLGASLDDTIALMNRPGARTPITAEWVGELMGSWSENVASWTGQSNPTSHVVRYEDMHARPITTFAGVARFLGLDPPRERIEKAIRLSSFRVLQEQERRHGFVEKSRAADRFFREGKTGAWRRKLTRAQVAALVEPNRIQMARFGYRPEELQDES
ncbi:MAG: sulfotransferase domain-containing protein [Alphaproteobacteria bacterium]